MKELTLQMEVDVLGCCIVDGAGSRSECQNFAVDVDEASYWVRLLSVGWLESE